MAASDERSIRACSASVAKFGFDIEYKKGTLNNVAEALSRMEKIAALKEITDHWYMEGVRRVELKPWRFLIRRVDNDLLYVCRSNEPEDPVTESESDWRMVVPANWRKRVMAENHQEAWCAHLGFQKTYDRICRGYYWRGMYYDVLDFVRSCEECQRHKSTQTGPQGLMSKRIVETPWAVVSADFMEFSRSVKGMKYLLVFQDLFTKWVELIPLRAETGVAIERAIEDLTLFRWETPHYLLCDHGTEFNNQKIKDAMKFHEVKVTHTLPYHHQANPTERVNCTLKPIIAMFAKDDHEHGDDHIPEFRYALNTAVQAKTRVSPAFLNFGCHPRLVRSLRREVEEKGAQLVEKLDPKIWAEEMKRPDHLRDGVRRHIEKAQVKTWENLIKVTSTSYSS